MARPISDEEIQLKRRARRRLIGAIVLVIAIVVILPMVLDTEPKPISGDISIKIPSPNSSTFTARVVPVPPSAEPKPAPKSPAEAQATPKLAAAMGERPEAAPDAPAPKAPEPDGVARPEARGEAPARATVEARATAPGGEPGAQEYAVQVAALADAEKVKQVQAQIAAGGLQSYTQVVKTAKGDVTRVRVGPFATRPAAEKAREQLHALGLAGNIVPK